jgi:hypothetical protein
MQAAASAFVAGGGRSPTEAENSDSDDSDDSDVSDDSDSSMNLFSSDEDSDSDDFSGATDSSDDDTTGATGASGVGLEMVETKEGGGEAKFGGTTSRVRKGQSSSSPRSKKSMTRQRSERRAADPETSERHRANMEKIRVQYTKARQSVRRANFTGRILLLLFTMVGFAVIRYAPENPTQITVCETANRALVSLVEGVGEMAEHDLVGTTRGVRLLANMLGNRGAVPELMKHEGGTLSGGAASGRDFRFQNRFVGQTNMHQVFHEFNLLFGTSMT